MARRSRVAIPRAGGYRNSAVSSDAVSHVIEETFFGLPDGMIVAVEPNMIPDTAARFIKDAFVHNPGELVRRGPVTELPGFSALPYSASGMASTVDPTGVIRVGVLHGDASHGYLGVYSQDWSTRYDLALGVNLPISPYRIVQTAPRLNGGIFITVMDKFSQGSAQSLLLWRGAYMNTYTTGTTSSTRGSTSVTGTGTLWRANTTAGSFLFIGGQYIGTVKSVGSDGVLTLEKPALLTASGAYSLQPFRGLNPRIAKGYITTSTTSTAVNGANTKFQADGLGTGTWDIYRMSDTTFIGTVASVVSDIQFNLAANATLNLDEEPYVAIRRDGSYSLSPATLGTIPTIWGGRQGYANNGSTQETTSQIRFSSVDDAEALDEAKQDGDYITVPSVGPAGLATPIVAMSPTPTSLLILKENEAYGLFGQTTDQFQIVPISSDGCLSPMSVQEWNGLAIYAGRQGIYMYDGQEAVNVTQQSLGWFYQEALKDFDTSKYRMWSLIDRDHYLLFVERVNPPLPVLKGTATQTYTSFTIAMHLPTRAVTILSNLNIRGSLQLPGSLEKGGTWYVVNNATEKGVLCSADSLFDINGNDDFGCDGGTAGPDFYLETKKYSFGDPLLKKLWKMVLLTYFIVGDTLRLDTVPGLNEIGTQAKTAFPTTGTTWGQIAAEGYTWATVDPALYPTWDFAVDSQFVTKRVKFLKRSQMMSFRFYQNSSAVKALTLGPLGVIAKPQRIGRV